MNDRIASQELVGVARSLVADSKEIVEKGIAAAISALNYLPVTYAFPDPEDGRIAKAKMVVLTRRRCRKLWTYWMLCCPAFRLL